VKISQSFLNDYLSCPRRAYFNHVLRLPRKPKHQLAIGIAVHSAIEAYFRSVVAGKPIDRGEYLDVYERELAANWSPDFPADAAKGLDTLIESYVESTKLRLAPAQVEVPFSHPIGAHEIVGRIDLIETDGNPADHKTSSSEYTQDKVDKLIQPTIYFLGTRAITKRWPEKFTFGVMVKAPQHVQYIETRRKIAEIKWFRRLAWEVCEAVTAGHFPPNPLAEYCGEKACDHWETCQSIDTIETS
jgi:hypothetical protein